MKGFTLIELLVVVVIIGILTAIALPQYELVVEKSRASEAMVNAKAIIDACQRHIQEYPEDSCNNKTKIADVQLKGGEWNEAGTCFQTKNFTYAFLPSPVQHLEVARMDTPNCGDTGGMLYSISYKLGEDTGILQTDSCDPGDDYYQVCKLFTNM